VEHATPALTPAPWRGSDAQVQDGGERGDDVNDGLVRPQAQLTHAGALVVLTGAVAKAQQMGVPQCIAVVDGGGNLLAYVRMDGAKVLSQISATNKAVTAASSRAPTGQMDAEIGLRLSVTTGGRLINIAGGLPIVIDGDVVGAVGVGSGTPQQDVEVGQAGIEALEQARAGA
jgi:glc operon protein GlcG